MPPESGMATARTVSSLILGRGVPVADTVTIPNWRGLHDVFLSPATDHDLDVVVSAGRDALNSGWPPAQRRLALARAAELLRAHRDEYVNLLVAECAKPLKESMAEVERAAIVLDECAEEATRLVGHMVPVDGVSGFDDRRAYTVRSPVGVVAAITPFNGPLLSSAHKAGAAIAAGCAVVLKPAERTSGSVCRFASDLLEAGVPAGRLGVLVGDGTSRVPESLVAHQGIDMVTFTGSTAVGLAIQRELRFRPAILELGGNAPTIVHRDADLSLVDESLASAAFGYTGQVCISTQRLLVHADVEQQVISGLLARAAALRVGSPEDPDTDIGPLISTDAADRVVRVIERVLDAGGQALTPIRVEGAFVHPVVIRLDASMERLTCEEVFGPVVFVSSYSDVDDAISCANGTRFGLQASIYTNDLAVAERAISRLAFGSVVINDSTRFRVDRMPYGGVKDSGIGVEGVPYTIRAMTREKLVISRPAPRSTDLSPP